jgi:hypothetical protein
MQARTRLPLALATFGLLPEIVSLDGLRWVPQASSAPCAKSP